MFTLFSYGLIEFVVSFVTAFATLGSAAIFWFRSGLSLVVRITVFFVAAIIAIGSFVIKFPMNDPGQVPYELLTPDTLPDIVYSKCSEVPQSLIEMRADQIIKCRYIYKGQRDYLGPVAGLQGEAFGIFTFKDGTVYSGQVWGGMPHGQGTEERDGETVPVRYSYGRRR